MNTEEIVLVDLSSIAHPVWHSAGSEPDPDYTSRKTVERVIELTRQHQYAAICCDSGRSFRKDLEPSYKANRPEAEAPLHHQIDVARETLKNEGYPVWAAKGFEADDVLASATKQALDLPNMTVLVISADKDMLQLVEPRVRVMSARDGRIYDEAGVKEKLGIDPCQMRDYLTLVGDASDNIKGAAKIGPVTAKMLLTRFGTLDRLYAELGATGNGPGLGLTPGVASSLREFLPRLEATRTLVTLRADVDLPFAEISVERTPKHTFTEGEGPMAAAEVMDAEPVPMEAHAEQETVTKPAAEANGNVSAPAEVQKPAPKTEIAVFDPTPSTASYELQLDPRNLKEAGALAQHMFTARLFNGYGNVQAVLSTILVGRELGMPAMASLRGIHIVEGRHALAAQTMVGLVLRSGMAEYFDPVEVSPTSVTYETKRKGARNPVRLTHTIEMAQQAGLVKPKSNWEKVPTDMLCARCSARLVRLVFPDLAGGLYSPEELQEVADARKGAA